MPTPARERTRTPTRSVPNERITLSYIYIRLFANREAIKNSLIQHSDPLVLDSFHRHPVSESERGFVVRKRLLSERLMGVVGLYPKRENLTEKGLENFCKI